MERLVDYVVGYACKGEISSTDAQFMFRRLVGNNAIDGTTSFNSLALRLNMMVLKSCDIPAAECLFSLQGLQYFHSSTSVRRVSLNVGSRTLNQGEDNESPIDEVVKLNQWDKSKHQPTGSDLWP